MAPLAGEKDPMREVGRAWAVETKCGRSVSSDRSISFDSGAAYRHSHIDNRAGGLAGKKDAVCVRRSQCLAHGVPPGAHRG